MLNLPSLTTGRKGNAAPPGKEVLLKTPSLVTHQAKGLVTDREAREAVRVARKDEDEIRAALEVSNLAHINEMKSKSLNEAFNCDIHGFMAGTLKRLDGRPVTDEADGEGSNPK